MTVFESDFQKIKNNFFYCNKKLQFDKKNLKIRKVIEIFQFYDYDNDYDYFLLSKSRLRLLFRLPI